jgi:2-haloacid dehalogenase
MKKNKAIKNIVFDLGGVLVDWNPRYLYRSVFVGREEQMEHFLNHVCNAAWNEKQDAGRTFSEAQKVAAEQYPEYKKEIEIYFERWPETIGGPISGTVEILSRLKASNEFKILALSNWSAETFHFARAKFSFLKHFEAVLVSGQEKLIKPDQKFFNLLTERHSIRPSESVFIDDVERNINAAREMGFHSVLFKNPQQLKTELDLLIPGIL